MNRDEVLRLAREAGFVCQRDEYLFGEMLERFASLVAAHEREQCAKACDEIARELVTLACDSEAHGADGCSVAIRARGES